MNTNYNSKIAIPIAISILISVNTNAFAAIEDKSGLKLLYNYNIQTNESIKSGINLAKNNKGRHGNNYNKPRMRKLGHYKNGGSYSL